MSSPARRPFQSLIEFRLFPAAYTLPLSVSYVTLLVLPLSLYPLSYLLSSLICYYSTVARRSRYMWFPRFCLFGWNDTYKIQLIDSTASYAIIPMITAMLTGSSPVDRGKPWQRVGIGYHLTMNCNSWEWGYNESLHQNSQLLTRQQAFRLGMRRVSGAMTMKFHR
jgi:hypothetical protein